MQKSPSVPFKLRLPPEVGDWVVRTAAMNRRSMNAEIVFRLEAAMRAEAHSQPPGQGGAPAAGEPARV